MQIKVKLGKSFTTTLNKMLRDNPQLARLNGFADEQLNYTDFIDNFIDEEVVADASIDGNASASQKDEVSLEKEMNKPTRKLLSFNKIYYELQKKYGTSTADDWLKNELDSHLYMHDAYSASFVSYCYAYDLKDLVDKGLYFIDNFNNQPPRHLNTFTDFVIEFVSFASNRTSGACGLPSFLPYSFYFWKKDCENNCVFRDPEYYKKQEFQRIIYKLNQPYVRVNQCAFTNFTIFDRPYFEAIFGGKEFPQEITKSNGEKSKYMIDFIDEFIEYEKDFMESVSKIRRQNVMTFPVLTYSLLKKDGKFLDEEFARWASEHNMRWGDANFYVSSDVTSLSNCCRLVSSIKDLGYFNSVGGTALEVGSVKVSTLNLARIAYESSSTTDYYDRLRQLTLLDLKALDRVRHIIQRNVEKNLLPNYSYGMIHLANQYNTVGIIGVYEALDKFGFVKTDKFGYHYYTDEGMSFAKNILQVIHETIDKYKKDENLDYMINIEQVPKKSGHVVR